MKPRLFKENNEWHCVYVIFHGIGVTPKMAYADMVYKRKRLMLEREQVFLSNVRAG